MSLDDDNDQLVDLSDPAVAELTTPPYIVVTLERRSATERWGFLNYNQRFPLTVGKVDQHRAQELQKGDVIMAIDFVVPASYEAAAAMIARAQLKLTLTIDRSHNVQHQTPAGASPYQLPMPMPSPQSDATSHAPSTSNGAAASSSEDVHTDSQPLKRSRKDGGVRGTPFQQGPDTAADVPPMTLQPLRSNVDLVLRHLPAPPRVAVYDRSRCPLNEDMGFNDDMHNFLAQFLVDQSLKSAVANGDVRFDALSAVAGSGISRLPNELLKDVSLRGAEFIKKRDAAQCGTVERERFLAQMNSFYASMLSVRQSAEADLREMAKAHVNRLKRAKDTLVAYRQLCGETVPGSDASSSANNQLLPIPSTWSGALPQQPQQTGGSSAPGNSHSAASAGLNNSSAAVLQSLARMMNACGAVPLPEPSPPANGCGALLQSSPSGGTASSTSDLLSQTHMSRKKRKRMRERAVKAEMAAMASATRAAGAGALPLPLDASSDPSAPFTSLPLHPLPFPQPPAVATLLQRPNHQNSSFFE